MTAQTTSHLRRKQFGVDARVLAALESLARDSKASLDDLIDEALRDLLKKRRRPLTLKDALRDSARALPANDAEQKAGLRSSKTPTRPKAKT